MQFTVSSAVEYCKTIGVVPTGNALLTDIDLLSWLETLFSLSRGQIGLA